jgi:phenylacetate-CoA ligase
VILAPEVETRPLPEQLALDDVSYRTQLDYLFERSAFYRDKLAAAGVPSGKEAGGLAEIAQLPLTDKQ